jgi:glycosyltransferase involved in cell wall biosynthesis
MTDWFSPAYRAGGPVQSVFRISQQLKYDFEIYILTSNRDLGVVLNEVSPGNHFVNLDGIQICYTSPEKLTYAFIKAQYDYIRPDSLFLNGIFNKYFSFFLLRFLTEISNPTLIVSARGMLRSSAISQKVFKKRIFILFLRLFSISKKVIFHCTSEDEVCDAKQYFGKNAKTVVIPNIPFVLSKYTPRTKKQLFKLLYASRIHPIKNLIFILNTLKTLKEQIIFTIIGDIEDEGYFNLILELCEQLPKNIVIDIKAGMPHEQLMSEMIKHHVFILPTLGENFGHSIYEALINGLPVILSDQTPWRNLENQKIGFDLPLYEPKKFTNAISFFANQSENEWREWSYNAHQFAINFYNAQNFKSEYSNLFNPHRTTYAVNTK